MHLNSFRTANSVCDTNTGMKRKNRAFWISYETVNHVTSVTSRSRRLPRCRGEWKTAGEASCCAEAPGCAVAWGPATVDRLELQRSRRCSTGRSMLVSDCVGLRKRWLGGRWWDAVHVTDRIQREGSVHECGLLFQRENEIDFKDEVDVRWSNEQGSGGSESNSDTEVFIMIGTLVDGAEHILMLA